MGTFTQIVYQIVFGTKYHEMTLHKKHRAELFSYMSGILRNYKCFVHRINGIEDHLHIISSLHPTVALSTLIKDLKLASTDLNKKKKLFPLFRGWQDGYFAATYSVDALPELIRYVDNQEEHHKKKSYLEEIRDLCKEHGIKLDERYFGKGE